MSYGTYLKIHNEHYGTKQP